jgi:hypothetical protein
MPRYVEDIEVWRAAQQIINLYPDEPELAAGQRADAAYEADDMFNFDLWTRIAKAVRELVTTKPHVGKAIN